MVSKWLRYTLYITMIVSVYLFFHSFDEKEYDLMKVKVMNISVEEKLFTKKVLFTVKPHKNGKYMQFFGTMEQAENCKVYDKALVKVIPSWSGRFHKFELVECVSR